MIKKLILVIREKLKEKRNRDFIRLCRRDKAFLNRFVEILNEGCDPYIAVIEAKRRGKNDGHRLFD